jgi:uncharacterized protein (DUF433 family)
MHGALVARGKKLSSIPAECICLDEKGVARIDGSRSKVMQIVMDMQAHGWGPEEIRAQYPHLTMAQIHAALAYYSDHQGEIDAQIDEYNRYSDAMRAATGEAGQAAVSVRYYMDEHVPSAITNGLRDRNVEIARRAEPLAANPHGWLWRWHRTAYCRRPTVFPPPPAPTAPCWSLLPA